MEAGTIAVTGPSTVSRMVWALCKPVARSRIARAFMIVPSPMVIAIRGTCSSDSKNLALSCRVFAVRVLTRVAEDKDEPSSLKPIWPSVPMPRICRSIPPDWLIAIS